MKGQSHMTDHPHQYHQLFSGHAWLYRNTRPRYPAELFEFIAEQVSLRRRAWDCGAGNGQASLGLAEYFTEVYATDVSEKQIRHGIQKSNIRYSVQPAEKTDFPGGHFDVVVVAQAFHWFQRDRFFEEVRRVSAEGAHLYV